MDDKALQAFLKQQEDENKKHKAMMKDMGFDMDAIESYGFDDPELDALAKEMGEHDEFAELNDLHGSDEEESKAVPKVLS